jgi:hypothetical protein
MTSEQDQANPPPSAKPLKVECWKCGREVKLTKGGTLPKHYVYRMWSTLRRTPKCPAGGTKP